MKHEFYEDYNEIMYDERDVIVKFLEEKDKLSIQDECGRWQGRWEFNHPVKLYSVKDCREIFVTAIRLHTDKILVFESSVSESEYTCDYFFYGELCKVIEALPEIEDMANINIMEELKEISAKYDVEKLLKQNPFKGEYVNFKFKDNYQNAINLYTDVSFDTVSKMNVITELKNHLRIAILHDSYIYKVMTDILIRTPVCNFALNYPPIINVNGIEMGVSRIQEDCGIIITARHGCNSIDMTEKDIKPEYLETILDEMLENSVVCYSKSLNNKHRLKIKDMTGLVKKINLAWRMNHYNAKFADILFAISQRDAERLKTEFNCIINSPEDAMNNHYIIFNKLCDDNDFECILKFIQWKDNMNILSYINRQ